MKTEQHPLEPFLPEDARILMLGSFPPQKKRWSMDFFYPNWTNDMWRIWGFIATGDKSFFEVSGEKRFDRDKIESFCRKQGIALYDTAEEVVRLKDNASDNFLQITRRTDIAALLERIPSCRAVVATGQKSADTLASVVGVGALPVGECCRASFAGRSLELWRMPSSSRAYPRAVEWKADYYRKMFLSVGGLVG